MAEEGIEAILATFGRERIRSVPALIGGAVTGATEGQKDAVRRYAEGLAEIVGGEADEIEAETWRIMINAHRAAAASAAR